MRHFMGAAQLRSLDRRDLSDRQQHSKGEWSEIERKSPFSRC
jgi:hypothetical protein